MTFKPTRNWRPDKDRVIAIDGTPAYIVDISSDKYPDTYTIVDPDIYQTEMHMKKWTPTRGAEGGLYARRNFGRKTMRLHRLITGAADGLHVDHKNGNALDNRRSNLRVCLPRLNAGNSKSSRGASAYKGVSPNASTINPWRAQICVQRKSIHLGSFATGEEAALAYNAAALKHFGEFALLNSVAPRSLDLASYIVEASANHDED